ncbi:MAG: hypothetical protein K5852_02590 [Eubacterium sp.]|nr:hypothetical protein [Eubacterium sp.]
MSNITMYDEILTLTQKVLEKYEGLVTLLKKESALKRSHRAYLPVRDQINILCEDAVKAIPELKKELRKMIMENFREEPADHELLALNGNYLVMPRDYIEDIYGQLLDLIDFIEDTNVLHWMEEVDDEGETAV